MKNWWLFLSLVSLIGHISRYSVLLSFIADICLLCDEVLLPWNFRSLGFDIRAPQDPPNMKKSIFFSYFGFKLQTFLSDCFLIWHVHGYGWEDSWKARYWTPPQGPPNSPKYTYFFTFWLVWKTGFQIVSSCCTYVSTMMRSAFADILGAPATPGFYVRTQHDPEKNEIYFIFFHIFYFNSKGSYQIVSILSLVSLIGHISRYSVLLSFIADICLLCDEVLLPWNFRSLGFDIRAPQDPPNMKKSIFFSYFGFKLQTFLSDCFLIWHVHGYGWEDSWKARYWTPPQGPPNSPKYTYFFYILARMKNWFSNCFLLLYICLHYDEVCICWHFGCPCYPWILCKDPTWPRKKWNLFYFFHIFYFNSKGSYQIVSIFDM